MPGDIRPGTEWGMMCGFSGDVTLWVLFGGRPGLELVGRKRRKWVRQCERWRGGRGVGVLAFEWLQKAIPFEMANLYCK